MCTSTGIVSIRSVCRVYLLTLSLAAKNTEGRKITVVHRREELCSIHSIWFTREGRHFSAVHSTRSLLHKKQLTIFRAITKQREFHSVKSVQHKLTLNIMAAKLCGMAVRCQLKTSCRELLPNSTRCFNTKSVSMILNDYLLHIFPKAQVAANKNAHNFRHHFLAQFLMLVIHFVRSVSFKNLEIEVF